MKSSWIQRLAVTAAVLTCDSLAEAVQLSSDGSGQVLLFPYYTAQRGPGVEGIYRSRLTIRNATDQARAMRVRFMEGENSRTVLEFNLFLAQGDAWSGTVVAPADDGAAGLITDDRSCVDPVFTESGAAIGADPAQKLARFSSAGFQADGGSSSPSRTREGLVEVIAMADLTGALATAVTSTVSNSTPIACHVVIGLQTSTASMLAPTPGLRGRADILNARNGVAFSYTADALRDFTRRELFAASGQPWPRLTDVNDAGYPTTATALVEVKGQTVRASYPQNRAIDAVSAVLMAYSLQNDYGVRPGVVNSEWVIAYPTKRYYTDPLYTAVPIPPFSEMFNGDSCTKADSYWIDASGRTQPNTCTGIGIPPPPPPGGDICKAATVTAINAPTVNPVVRSPILGSGNVTNVWALFEEGLLDLRLAGCHGFVQMRTSVAPNADKDFFGHPVIGFAITRGGDLGAKRTTPVIHSILPHRRSLICSTTLGGDCS